MSTEIVLSHISFALLLFLLLPVRKLPPAARLGLLTMMALIGAAQIEGVSLANYVRSVTNDLAMTTLLWLTWCALAKIGNFPAPSARHHGQLALFFGSSALLLYPATLGLLTFDPYRLGYSPAPLFVLVFALCLVFWLRRHYLGAILLTAATAAFVLGLKPSANYLDYLIDPLLGLYCCSYLLWYALRHFWKSFTLNHDLMLPARTIAATGCHGTRSIRCKSPALSTITARPFKTRARRKAFRRG